MKTITIGFSKPRTVFPILSWIIRMWEGSEYSHVFVRIIARNIKNDLFYHASGLSVNFMGNDLFYKNHKVLDEFIIEIDEDKYLRMLDIAIDRVGYPYSIGQLLGIVMIRLFRIFGKKINNPFGKSGYICTEIAAEVLKEVCGVEIEKELNSITLNDIHKTLTNKMFHNESN